MKTYEVDSTYRQIYVADQILEPEAPEDWTDTHVQQRHNTQYHISALCPAGDIVARVISYGPREAVSEPDDKADFDIVTAIDVPSGQIGVFGWPWELQDSYTINPGIARIRFRGFRTADTDDERDYYVIEIEEAEPNVPERV